MNMDRESRVVRKNDNLSNFCTLAAVIGIIIGLMVGEMIISNVESKRKEPHIINFETAGFHVTDENGIKVKKILVDDKGNWWHEYK